MPLSIYNPNPKCFHHYTIKPDQPGQKPLPMEIKPQRQRPGGIERMLLSCNPKVLKGMTIPQIAEMLDLNPPSVHNVMSRLGIPYERIKKKGGGRKKG